MRKLLFLFLLLIVPFSTGFAKNNVVKEITPQSAKLDFFQNFQNEKDYIVDLAFNAIIQKTTEKPVAWYSKYSTFKKTDSYTAGKVLVRCTNHKLATCLIKYEMKDTAFRNKALVNMSDSDISGFTQSWINSILKYKSIPYICCREVKIEDDYLE
ncbi:MAG: hypothetical protein KBS60_05805 [Phascolarctobacterium sp.]|nr:hypothetical protein [Candidatus Phascolarctobacterium caballi]